MWGKRSHLSMNHLTAKYNKLAQKKCKLGHENIARILQLEFYNSTKKSMNE